MFLTAKQGIESYMSGPEKWKQIFWFIGKKKHEGCVTVTPKLASNKDIVAGEYRESFSESDQSTYQEHQQSLVILITQEKIINYISTIVQTPIQFSPVNTPGRVDRSMKWRFSATWVFLAFIW